MSQSDYVIETTSVNGNSFRDDLLAAIKAAASLNYGSTAPSYTEAGLAWLDSSATPWAFKVRNAADDAWITLLQIDDSDDKIQLIAKLLTMTGQILAAGGTVGAPGLAFSGDPDTGLYRVGANALGLVAAGASVLEIADKVATLKKQVRSSVLTLTSSTGISVDLTAENMQFVTLDHDTTFTVSGEAVGHWATLVVKQGATGGTGAWAGVDAWRGGSAPVLSTTTGEYDVISFSVPEAGVVLASHAGPFG